MSIFQHFVAGGQWHYCHSCGQKGDMLQLAARVWGLSIPATITKCINLGFAIPKTDVASVTEYVNHYHNIPQRADSVWTAAREGGLYSGGRRLAGQMHWRVNPAVSWNRDGLDQVLGCLPAEKIQSLLAGGEKSRNKPWPVNGVTIAAYSGRLFRGKDWGDVLVFPYYDLPGRIVGLQFVGLGGSDKGRIFAYTDASCELATRESGLAGHPNTFRHSGTVVAFRDYYWYLRMQCRQLELRAESAPLVCWRSGMEGSTQHAWKQLRSSKIVFWDSMIDIPLLKQAILVDGWIANPGITSKEEIARYLSDTQPSEMCIQCERKAVPWPAALAEFFRDKPDTDVEDLLLQLEASGEDMASVLSRCPTAFSKRARRVVHRTRTSRSVLLDSRTIEERPDGWYVKKGTRDERILNAIPRFDSMVWYPQSGQAQYQGRLLYGRQEIPFKAARELVEGDTVRWMQGELLKARAGVLQHSPSWAKRIVAIATRFHEPKMVTGLETVGWDEQRSAFVLPNYAIQFGGEVTEHTHFRNEAYNTPGNLPKPGRVNPTVVMKAVESTEGSRSFWSLFTAIAANIVAPAVNRSRSGIALMGYPVQPIANAAVLATDCSRYKIEDLKLSFSIVPHRWPCYIEPGVDFSSKGKRLYIETCFSRYDLIEVDQLQAASLLLSGRFHVAEAAPDAMFDLALAREMGGVLPSYLQYLAQTKFEDLRTDGSFLSVLRHSLAGWVQNTFGCQPHAIYGLDARWINIWERDQTNHAVFLARLLHRLMSDGHAILVPLKHDDPKAIWQGKKGIYLPKVLLRDCLLRGDGVPLDVDNVTKQLAASNCLIGETVKHGRSCWLIDEEWLATQIHAARVNRTGLIRLAEGT